MTTTENVSPISKEQPAEHYLRCANAIEQLRDMLGMGYGEGDIEEITRIIKARSDRYLEYSKTEAKGISAPVPQASPDDATALSGKPRLSLDHGDELVAGHPSGFGEAGLTHEGNQPDLAAELDGEVGGLEHDDPPLSEDDSTDIDGDLLLKVAVPCTPAPVPQKPPPGAPAAAQKPATSRDTDEWGGAAVTRREKIRAKIMARVRIDEATGCWIWTGPTSGENGRGAGYPRMSMGGQTVAVHLVMWTNEHGYIPGKKQIDHVCRNRLCVRPEPDHLELVTRKRNILRQWEARRAMRCEEVEA